VDGILLRPLPYRDPQRLVMLTSYAPRPPFDSNGSVSFNDFVQFRAKSKSFSDLAISFRTGWSRVTLTAGSEPVSMQGAFVSPNLLAIAEGRGPILGRTFTAEEDRRAQRVVVIGESLWAERFGSSPTVIGRSLEIGHARWQVIGVMPSDFRLPFLNTQVWAPLHSHPEWNSTEESNPLDRARWDVIGRLKSGTSLTTASAEVDSIWNGLRAALPESHTNDLRIVPLREYFAGTVRKPAWLLFGAVVFLLLIACVNVANLLLARSTQRTRELSVRAALGAGRTRLLRQLVTEALSFSCAAGAIGALIAFQSIPLLKALAPANTPLLDTVTLNGRGLLFALAISVAVGVVLGIAPLSRLSHGELNGSLTGAGRSLTETSANRRLKNLLVAGEFALAMVLITGAGLLVRSFIAVLNVNVGFSTQNLVTARLSLPGTIAPAQTPRLYREIMQRIAALPDVHAVGGASNLFYLDERRTHGLRLVEGYPPEPEASWKPLVWTQIAGDYFQTMRIPLIRGRFFGKDDRPESPVVAIVNETLARRYWHGANAIGNRIKGFDPRGKHDDWLTVVGVVGDVRVGGLERAPFSQIYELQAQRSVEQIENIVVRTSGNPAPLSPAIRSIIHSVTHEAVVSSVSSVDFLLEQQEIQRRFQTWLLSLFSGIALVLAALGILAVMYYAVTGRTAEIGIRMSTGATSGDITRLILGGAIRLAIYGIAAGAFVAILLTKAMAGFLYEVKPMDPITFAGAALLLLTVALVASYVPANRASHVDPLIALRQD
jgi:predicted permease